MIFPLLKGKNDGLRYHYFNDQNIHLLPEEFKFISCKYLYFVENNRKINEKSWKGINEYFYAKKLAHFNVNVYFLIKKKFLADF